MSTLDQGSRGTSIPDRGAVPTTGAELIALLASGSPAAQVLAVCSVATGADVVNALVADQGVTLTSLVMDGGGPMWDPDHGDGAVASLERLLGTVDPSALVFADPLHDYETARPSLQLVLAKVRDDGWLVVHDCLSYPWQMSRRQHCFEWAGATAAAFRDVAMASGRPWFVVDTDFGLGVIGPVGATITVAAQPALERRWGAAQVQGRVRLVRRHGDLLMRSINPVAVRDLLDALRSGGVGVLPQRTTGELRRIRRQRRILGVRHVPMRASSTALFLAIRHKQRLGPLGPRLVPLLGRWKLRFDLNRRPAR